MSCIVGIHECQLEPTDCSSFEEGEDEEGFLLIVSKDIGAVSEVKVT
jgi:hypothetical protein